MNFLNLLADGTARDQNFTQTIIMVVVAILFFYFILWRPEQKRRKKVETQRNTMKVGDKVTAMGIIGTIDQIQDNTIVLKMIDGAKVEMIKQAVTEVHSPDTVEAKS